eukprot:COSAG02_NODE_2230_length_9425_cov_5.740039_7_plen_50_part_00
MYRTLLRIGTTKGSPIRPSSMSYIIPRNILLHNDLPIRFSSHFLETLNG